MGLQDIDRSSVGMITEVFAEGGEAWIHEVTWKGRSLLFKEYKNAEQIPSLRRLQAISSIGERSESFSGALPVCRVMESSNPVGVLVPCADVAFMGRYGPRHLSDDEEWHLGETDKFRVMGHLLRQILLVHESGLIVGDLKAGNVLYYAGAGEGRSYLVDCDSFSMAGERCLGMLTMYPDELATASVERDFYGFARLVEMFLSHDDGAWGMGADRGLSEGIERIVSDRDGALLRQFKSGTRGPNEADLFAMSRRWQEGPTSVHRQPLRFSPLTQPGGPITPPLTSTPSQPPPTPAGLFFTQDPASSRKRNSTTRAATRDPSSIVVRFRRLWAGMVAGLRKGSGSPSWLVWMPSFFLAWAAIAVGLNAFLWGSGPQLELAWEQAVRGMPGPADVWTFVPHMVAVLIVAFVVSSWVRWTYQGKQQLSGRGRPRWDLPLILSVAGALVGSALVLPLLPQRPEVSSPVPCSSWPLLSDPQFGLTLMASQGNGECGVLVSNIGEGTILSLVLTMNAPIPIQETSRYDIDLILPEGDYLAMRPVGESMELGTGLVRLTPDSVSMEKVVDRARIVEVSGSIEPSQAAEVILNFRIVVRQVKKAELTAAACAQLSGASSVQQFAQARIWLGSWEATSNPVTLSVRTGCAT